MAIKGPSLQFLHFISQQHIDAAPWRSQLQKIRQVASLQPWWLPKWEHFVWNHLFAWAWAEEEAYCPANSGSCNWLWRSLNPNCVFMQPSVQRDIWPVPEAFLGCFQSSLVQKRRRHEFTFSEQKQMKPKRIAVIFRWWGTADLSRT